MAWDAEQTESAEEIPLEAEEEPAMEDETDSYETVLVEAEDLHAEDNAAEGVDIPQPSTPPAAVTEGDQMEGANDLAMQDVQLGAADAMEETRRTGMPPPPGWLFSEETLQLAAAHGIRSAVVDGREVLLPRPTVRQTPEEDSTPCNEGTPRSLTSSLASLGYG